MLPEDVDSEGEDDPEIVLATGPAPLIAMLEMVAFKRRMVGVEADVWVESVMAKFAQVRITSLRDYVSFALVINRRLHDAGLKQLHDLTLAMMSREVAEMLWGPEEV